MHPLNPVLATAVITQIGTDRRETAARAIARREQPPFSGLRRRVAARRGRSPVAVPVPPVPVRAGRA
jgi:hypothetical protein